jgi:hypothetical protein
LSALVDGFALASGKLNDGRVCGRLNPTGHQTARGARGRKVGRWGRVQNSLTGQQQLHANRPPGEALDELPHRLRNLVPFSDHLLQFLRHVLGGIARPAYPRIEGHHA